MTYPFQNFNGATVEVWEWISNFIPHFPGHVITYLCWAKSLHMLAKGAPVRKTHLRTNSFRIVVWEDSMWVHLAVVVTPAPGRPHVGPMNLAIWGGTKIDWQIIIIIIMTSSNGNIFRVTGHLCGEFTGPRWIPRTKASDAELWYFFDLRLNKRLSKQSWGWWFETLSRPLWRRRNNWWCSIVSYSNYNC